MGNLDFLENKPTKVVISIDRDKMTELWKDASNCLPALSIKTLYSTFGQTADASDSGGANRDCSVRVSSDVNFTPSPDAVIYDSTGEIKTTDFHVCKFTDGVAYVYSTKKDMDIGSAGAPPPCIIIPKTFTDSESSALFEKGVYLGIGISSGYQTWYTKFEQKIIRVSINISGKGFTSPQKPYRYATRSFNSDDVISIFYNKNIIPDTDEAKSKGFNAICAPGDWNTKADIKLNKDLADIVKAGNIGCLNIYIHDDLPMIVEDTSISYRPFIVVTYDKINSIGGLCIREIDNGNITVIYFNPLIKQEEYDIWLDKYLSLEP